MKKTILPEHTARLVEQHRIYPTDPRYEVIDAASFASKNIYNSANYEVRQHFFATGHILSYETLYHWVKKSDAFLALPQKVSQQTVLQVARAWAAFREARKAYRQDPSRCCLACGHIEHADSNSGQVLVKRFGDTELSQVGDYREAKAILLRRFDDRFPAARSAAGGLDTSSRYGVVAKAVEGQSVHLRPVFQTI
jgi:hypothetical protein